MNLQDRVAVVTGSGSGIGRASALEFARAGARVVIVDINAGAARETVAQIQSAGSTAIAVGTDIANPDSVQRLVAETLRAFGRVDVLMNNAAIQVNKTVEDTTVEGWNREMAVNVGGIFLCCKYFFPTFAKRKERSSTCLP